MSFCRDAAAANVCDLIFVSENAFCEEKARGESFIVARRTHRDGDRAMLEFAVVAEAEADFERLLYRKKIVELFVNRHAVDTPNARSRISRT